MVLGLKSLELFFLNKEKQDMGPFIQLGSVNKLNQNCKVRKLQRITSKPASVGEV